jgi:hypothetical protein
MDVIKTDAICKVVIVAMSVKQPLIVQANFVPIVLPVVPFTTLANNETF